MIAVLVLTVFGFQPAEPMLPTQVVADSSVLVGQDTTDASTDTLAEAPIAGSPTESGPIDLMLQIGLGAVIALLASWSTYLFSRRQEYLRSRTTHIGLLKAIHAELSWHQNHTRRLRSSLSEVKRLCVEAGDFVVGKTPEPFHLQWLEACRSRLLEFRSVDMPTVHLLSTYVNLVRETNSSLDFTTARELIDPDDRDANRASIEGYFDTLETEYTGKLHEAADWLKDRIERSLAEMRAATDLAPDWRH